MLLPSVHLVTDCSLAPDLAAVAHTALRGVPAGAVAVHLRAKNLSGREVLLLARALHACCRDLGQVLLVNERVDVVLAAEADGVHLPSAGIPPVEARRLLGPRRLIGVSCHSLEDVRGALAGGADYATFGPVFDTPSKRRYGPPLGLKALRQAVLLGLPLVGLGGVDLTNAPDVLAAGALGVAAIRAWLAAPEPAQAVATLVGMAREARPGGTRAP
ncbi:MAG TPA: thiamine phosphate synthase [Anaeromyxobacteraceae bacterium]|nr:thiamine phosphate synthase [Anaeromyxobacteraceae bacterium]